MIRTIISIRQKLRSLYNDMSILGKMNSAYIITIVMLVFVTGYYNYYTSQANFLEEGYKNSGTIMSQIKKMLIDRLNNVRNISEGICYNASIQKFLYNTSDNTSDITSDVIETYKDNIYNLVDNTFNVNKYDIYKISVYMQNNNIPERWNYFYNEKRLNKMQWYLDFKSYSMQYKWFYPVKVNRYYPHGSNENNEITFAFIRNINTIFNKHLGVLLIDIRIKEMFSFLDEFKKNETDFYVVDQNDNILYNSSYIDPEIISKLKNLKESSNSLKDNSYLKNNDLYTYEIIEPLGVKIIGKFNMSRMFVEAKKASRNTTLSIIMGMSILELFTYFLIKNILSKLKVIVKTMNTVSTGDFNKRIPIESKDELGQISNDFNILIEKINMLLVESIKKETAHKDTQLMALQFQINPHFIYNTIDTFRMKMELNGEYEIAEAIADFGKVLRYNLRSQSKYTLIQDEILHVESYFSIQQLRFGNRVKLIIKVDEELKKYSILRFILQPAVENSIKYGLKSSSQILDICIEIKHEERVLYIFVKDNGAGINPRQIERLNYQLRTSSYDNLSHKEGEGIGLSNINERIKMFYGERFFVKLESKPYNETITIIRIPYDPEKYSMLMLQEKANQSS